MSDTETTVPTTSTKFHSGGHYTGYSELMNLKDVVNGDARDLKNDVNGVAQDLKNAVTAGFTAVQVAEAANSAATILDVEKTSAATILDVEKTSAASSLASSLNFSNTQNMLISGFKDGRYDASQNTASIQQFASTNATAMALAFKDAAILALQNKADSDAKAAECCCEIKTLIIADGEKTRGLVSGIDRERLRDQAQRLEDEIVYLKGRVPSGTPV
jgi:hypothetical protein